MKSARITTVALLAALGVSGAGCDLGEVPIVAGMFAELEGAIDELYEGQAVAYPATGTLVAITSQRAEDDTLVEEVRLEWRGSAGGPAGGRHPVTAPTDFNSGFAASYSRQVDGQLERWVATTGHVDLRVVDAERIAGSARFTASPFCGDAATPTAGRCPGSDASEADLEVMLEFTATRAACAAFCEEPPDDES